MIGQINVDVEALKLKAYYTFKAQISGDSSSIQNIVFTTSFDTRGRKTYSMVINGVASSQNIADATGVALGADVAIKAENDKQMSIQMPGHASGAQHGSGQPK